MKAVKQYIDALQECLARLPLPEIYDVIAALHHARLGERQVFIVGNGGSAATASHFACDLGKGTAVPGVPRFRAIALTDNTSLLSAYANDFGYEHVFAEQLVNLARKGDVVIAISGSGNSPNVLRALELARREQLTTIGFTGFDGGRMEELVDLCVVVPSNCMEQIEDVHLILEHLVCTCLRQSVTSDSWRLPDTLVPERRELRLEALADCA